MSASSFPRSEHIALLRQRIEARVRLQRRPIEVAERGVNQLKCQYKFGLRAGASGEWQELAVHFQFAERFQTTGDDVELNRVIDGFLSRLLPSG